MYSQVFPRHGSTFNVDSACYDIAHSAWLLCMDIASSHIGILESEQASAQHPAEYASLKSLRTLRSDDEDENFDAGEGGPTTKQATEHGNSSADAAHIELSDCAGRTAVDAATGVDAHSAHMGTAGAAVATKPAATNIMKLTHECSLPHFLALCHELGGVAKVCDSSRVSRESAETCCFAMLDAALHGVTTANSSSFA